MSFSDEKTAARAMLLRPNPEMYLHILLAKRSTLHLDIFARIRPEEADLVLFTMEMRAGGRGDPVEHHQWLAVTDTMAAPKRVRGKTLAGYHPVNDLVRFNTGYGRQHHDWAREYHHRYMRPMIMDREWRPNVKMFNHVSTLFHYWNAFDLAPFPDDFVNWYMQSGRGRHNVRRETGTNALSGADMFKKPGSELL